MSPAGLQIPRSHRRCEAFLQKIVHADGVSFGSNAYCNIAPGVHCCFILFQGAIAKVVPLGSPESLWPNSTVKASVISQVSRRPLVPGDEVLMAYVPGLCVRVSLTVWDGMALLPICAEE